MFPGERTTEEYIAGVDIGGTWTRVAICTLDLREENLKKISIKTLKKDKHSIANSVCEILSELLFKFKIKTEQLLGIGIASAGPLNTETGVVFNNANLGFREIPLKRPIEEKFPDNPLYFINDGNAAVLGVHFFEANDEEKDNLAYITISTGIGGGVICNGHLLLGKEGNAAEIGHALVEPRSTVKCNCGAQGCWEAYSSGTGVRNRTLNALSVKKLKGDKLLKIVGSDISKITAKEVFQAAREGDELSLSIVQDSVFYIKVGVGLINNYYDCSSIYFGGAMMKDKEQIIPSLINQFKKNPIKFTINNPPNIKLTKFEDEIGLRGSLVYVKYQLENHHVVN
ncbi:MAG: ROK family protein [Candidatus Heimdallarchaeota archaeon]